MARFDGKVALVTGAGSGIGRAVALRLTGEGAQVLAHDLNADALGETAELVADAGASLETRTGDISGRDECTATVAAVVERSVASTCSATSPGSHAPSTSPTSRSARTAR